MGAGAGRGCGADPKLHPVRDLSGVRKCDVRAFCGQPHGHPHGQPQGHPGSAGAVARTGTIAKDRASHWVAGSLSARMLDEQHELRWLVAPAAIGADEPKSWGWLPDPRLQGRVAMINDPVLGMIEAALAVEARRGLCRHRQPYAGRGRRSRRGVVCLQAAGAFPGVLEFLR